MRIGSIELIGAVSRSSTCTGWMCTIVWYYLTTEWIGCWLWRRGKVRVLGLCFLFLLYYTYCKIQSENILTTCLFNKIKKCIHIHDLRPGPTDRWFHFFYSDVLDCWQSFLKEAVVEETQWKCASWWKSSGAMMFILLFCYCIHPFAKQCMYVLEWDRRSKIILCEWKKNHVQCVVLESITERNINVGNTGLYEYSSTKLPGV